MAALDLKSSFQKIKERHESIWLNHNGKKVDLSLRCGIHLGKVIFGILETDSRKQVTVIGSNVNLASRLVDFGEKDKIIVLQELANVARKDFRFRPIDVATRTRVIKPGIKSFPEVSFELRGKA